MAQYWLQNDVLKVINGYSNDTDIIDELLELKTYNDDGKPLEQQQITNINFICSKDKVEDILESIAKKNNGQITIIKEEKYD